MFRSRVACSFFLVCVMGFVGPFLLVLVSLGFRFSLGLLLISFGVSQPKFGLLCMLTVLAALLLARWGSCSDGTT